MRWSVISPRLPPPPLEVLDRFRFERLEVPRGGRRIERREGQVRELGHRRQVRHRKPQCGEGGGDVAEREDDLLHAKLAAERAAMQRPGAAKAIDHEIARIVPPFDRHLADEVRHMVVHDLDDAGGGVADADAERLGDLLLDRVLGELAVELEVAAQEIIGIDVAEHDVGIGNGRIVAAAAVAGGAGIGAGAHRADLEPAQIRPGDRAPAGADRDDVDGGRQQRVLVDGRGGRDDRLAVGDQADIEAGAADIGADDVAMPQQVAEELRGDDAAGRARGERVDRAKLRIGRAHGAAHGLHHQERRIEAAVAERALQPGQVAGQQRRDMCVPPPSSPSARTPSSPARCRSRSTRACPAPPRE